jgi:hypothetical protein
MRSTNRGCTFAIVGMLLGSCRASPYYTHDSCIFSDIAVDAEAFELERHTGNRNQGDICRQVASNRVRCSHNCLAVLGISTDARIPPYCEAQVPIGWRWDPPACRVADAGQPSWEIAWAHSKPNITQTALAKINPLPMHPTKNVSNHSVHLEINVNTTCTPLNLEHGKFPRIVSCTSALNRRAGDQVWTMFFNRCLLTPISSYLVSALLAKALAPCFWQRHLLEIGFRKCARRLHFGFIFTANTAPLT